MNYRLQTLVSFFKRQINRIKIIPRLLRHYRYAFDLVDTLPDMLEELYCIFYEKGEIELIHWDWHKEQGNRKFGRKELDAIYNWIKIDKKKIQAEIEDCYSKYIIYPGMLEDSTKNEDHEKFNRSLIKQVIKLERKLFDAETRILTLIINNRDLLWT